MDEQRGELDITSEGFAPVDPFGRSSKPLPKRPLPKRPQQNAGRIRLYFKCCRVFTLQTMPVAVLFGQLSVWRVHCPRCGSLSEIPVED